MSFFIPDGYYPLVLHGVYQDISQASIDEARANQVKVILEQSPSRCFMCDASDTAPGMFYLFKEGQTGDLRLYASSIELCADSPADAYAKAVGVIPRESVMHATPIGIMWLGAMPALTMH